MIYFALSSAHIDKLRSISINPFENLHLLLFTILNYFHNDGCALRNKQQINNTEAKYYRKWNGLNTIPVKEMCKNFFVCIRVRNYHLSSYTHIVQKTFAYTQKVSAKLSTKSYTIVHIYMQRDYIPYNIPHIESSHESHTMRHVLLFFMFNYLEGSNTCTRGFVGTSTGT